VPVIPVTVGSIKQNGCPGQSGQKAILYPKNNRSKKCWINSSRGRMGSPKFKSQYHHQKTKQNKTQNILSLLKGKQYFHMKIPFRKITKK
jgi:hypothetical protein